VWQQQHPPTAKAIAWVFSESRMRQIRTSGYCHHRWASRVASGPLCLHAVANTRQVRWKLVRSYVPIVFGLPRIGGGSAPALRFSRPAQRLLRLRPAFRAESPMRPSTPKASGSFVASATASIATGWNEPVPGRDFSPAEDQRLFTAHSDLRVTRWDLGDHFRIADDSTVCDDLSLCGRRFSLIRLSA
jgi:hypothetical protein